MNKKVKRLVKGVRLAPEEITRAAYQRNKLFEEYSQMAYTRKSNADECIAEAQLNKVLNDPGLALIDWDFLWKIKAMLRGTQIKQQNDPTIIWETALDVALRDFDSMAIPLAEALKEVEG